MLLGKLAEKKASFNVCKVRCTIKTTLCFGNIFHISLLVPLWALVYLERVNKQHKTTTVHRLISARFTQVALIPCVDRRGHS